MNPSSKSEIPFRSKKTLSELCLRATFDPIDLKKFTISWSYGRLTLRDEHKESFSPRSLYRGRGIKERSRKRQNRTGIAEVGQRAHNSVVILARILPSQLGDVSQTTE